MSESPNKSDSNESESATSLALDLDTQEEQRLKAFVQEQELPARLLLPQDHLSHEVKQLSEHLLIAVAWGWPLERIEALLQEGARPDYPNRRGVTSIALASVKAEQAEDKETRLFYESVKLKLTQQSLQENLNAIKSKKARR